MTALMHFLGFVILSAIFSGCLIGLWSNWFEKNYQAHIKKYNTTFEQQAVSLWVILILLYLGTKFYLW